MKRPTLTTLAGLLLVLAVVVAAQALVGTFHLRADLTDKKLYTIGDVSKKTLRGLDDILTVNVYLSDKLPPELSSIRRDIEDLLTEFRIFSNGRVNFSFQDPTKSDILKQKAREEGIAEAPFTVLDKDQQTTIYGFMGLSMTYKDKTERIPMFSPQNLQNLEYELMSRVLKLVREENPVLGFSTGHGESTAQATQLIRTKLADQYAVQDVDLVREPMIPPAVKTLIVLGPTSPFTEKDVYLLDQFVMRGGSVAVFVDTLDQSKNSPMPSRAIHGLDAWISHLGLRLTGNLVADRSSQMVQFPQGMGMMSIVQYPFFVTIAPQGINRKVQAMSNVGPGVVMPWPGEMIKGEPPKGVSLKELLQSTADSWTVAEPFDIQPNPALMQRPGDGRPKLLAALVKGKIPAFYSGPAPAGVPEGQERLRQPKATSQVLVVTSAKMLEDAVGLGQGRNVNNVAFFLNLMDQMTLDSGLSEIRARTLGAAPLDKTKLESRYGDANDPKVDSKVPRYKLVFTLLMPLLMVLVALVRSVMVAKTRRVYEEAVGA